MQTPANHLFTWISAVNDPQQTEFDQLREENVSLRQQLERCQKMTALGELVSTTTHEFNNVLMTIMNYAKMGMRYDDKETRDKAFDKINQASNRAAKITNAVLGICLLYTSPSPRDRTRSRMPSSA